MYVFIMERMTHFFNLQASESKRYLFLGFCKTTQFILYLDVSQPDGGLKILSIRVKGSHCRDHLVPRKEVMSTLILNYLFVY
jgi:protease II